MWRVLDIPPIIKINGYYFALEVIFNQRLKLHKDINHIRFSFEWVKLHIFGEVVNKYYVVFEVINRVNLRSPNIRKKKITSRGELVVRVETEKGNL